MYKRQDLGSGGSLIEAALDDFKLEAIAYDSITGDINFDLNVDILDVVLMVNIILDDFIPTDSQFNAADLDQDAEITVLDIVSLVSLVLGN